MRSYLARRPSPAMAVAFVALLAALSGTAIALPGTSTVDSGDIKNGAVRGKDIRKNAVTGKKVKNNSLKGADVAESSLGEVPTANSANNANSATTAGSAQPVAFAQVALNGTVVAANSKGVTDANVTHPDTGVYCVSGLAFDIRGAAVNTMFTGTSSFAQFTEGNTGNCPNGGQILTRSNAGAPVDQSFHVVLYG